MNILQVLPELGAGGVEQTTIEITEALIRAGHNAHVASLGGSMEKPFLAVGGRLHKIAVGSKNPLHLMANIQALKTIIHKHNIDIVHARSRAPAWAAYQAARATGRIFITTYHGIYNARFKLKRQYNSIMAKGDMVIANSEFTKAHIIQEHGTDAKKIRVIPRGVDVDVFDPAKVTQTQIEAIKADWNIVSEHPILLHPARLTRLKGQLVAVAALKILQDRGIKCQLVLLGAEKAKGDFKGEIMALAGELGLADYVKIPGQSHDMPTALMAANMVLSASIYPESFGRVMVEAQAMGRLCVASNHGGSLETIQDGQGGILVPPKDQHALAHAMYSLLMLDHKTIAARGRAARNRVKSKFSLAHMQAATCALYQTLSG